MKKMIMIFALLITSLSANAQRDNSFFISTGTGYLTKVGSSSFAEFGVNSGVFMGSLRAGYTSNYNEWCGKALVGLRLVNTDVFHMYMGGIIGISEYGGYYNGYNGGYPPNHPAYQYQPYNTEVSLNYGALTGIGFNLHECVSLFGEVEFLRNHRYKENSIGFHVGIRIHFGNW